MISYGVNYDGSPVGDGLTPSREMEQPVYYWDPVIAPGGMTFYRGDRFAGWTGDVLIGAMNPDGLVRLELDDRQARRRRGTASRRRRPRPRRRDGPDGALLLLIDAEDGKLLRLTPSNLTQ